MSGTLSSAGPSGPTPTAATSPHPRPRSTSRARGLVCVECGTRTGLAPVTACAACLGPLAVEYDLSPGRSDPSAEALAPRVEGLARFAELLPPVEAPELAYALEATPLRSAVHLAQELDLAEVLLKDDTVLPTGSFKDRPATVATSQAIRFGFPAVGCASTGNLAAATARAATRAGLPAFIFVPRGLPASKLEPVRRFGGTIVEVEGTYDAANRVAYLAGESARVGLLNITLRPFYTEGSKVAWHETLAALGGRAPSHHVVPLGSGALLAATARAIAESRALGALPSGDPGPALIGSQPVGCAPIVEAFERGTEEIRPVEHPSTIAESLAIGDPASGPEALRAIRASRGTADSPGTDDVLRAIRDLARLEGVWVEPAGGTVIASLRRLRESGTLRRSDRVVVHLTGAGWKTTDLPTTQDPAASIVIDPRRSDLSETLSRVCTRVPDREVGPW
jgi:threonine synthase